MKGCQIRSGSRLEAMIQAEGAQTGQEGIGGGLEGMSQAGEAQQRG